MNVPRLVWGYGPTGYDILARSRDLDPHVEQVFLDMGERWPFNDARESLVLARYEVPRYSSCLVLARSRMHQADPVHRQTAYALFRSEDVAAHRCGLRTLISCLPPYSPTDPLLGDVGLSEAEGGSWSLSGASDGSCASASWLASSWLVLVFDGVLHLPTLSPADEMAAIDGLIHALPPRIAARTGVALGLRHSRVAMKGPAIIGASDESVAHQDVPAGTAGNFGTSVALLRGWLDEVLREANDGSGIAGKAAALRAAILAVAAGEGLQPEHLDRERLLRAIVCLRSAKWLSAADGDGGVGARESLAMVLRDRQLVERLTGHLQRFVRERSQVGPARVGMRLLREVLRVDAPVLPSVPGLVASLLFEGDLASWGARWGETLPDARIAFPRLQDIRAAVPAAVEASYWSLVGNWLSERSGRERVELMALLLRPWSRSEGTFGYDFKWCCVSWKLPRGVVLLAAGSGWRGPLLHADTPLTLPVASIPLPTTGERLVGCFIAAALELMPRFPELSQTVRRVLTALPWTESATNVGARSIS